MNLKLFVLFICASVGVVKCGKSEEQAEDTKVEVPKVRKCQSKKMCEVGLCCRGKNGKALSFKESEISENWWKFFTGLIPGRCSDELAKEGDSCDSLCACGVGMICVPNILCRNCGNICMAIEFVEKLVFYYDIGCVCGESILVSLSGTNTAGTISESIGSKPQSLLPTLPNFPTLPPNLPNIPSINSPTYQQNQNGQHTLPNQNYQNQPQQQNSQTTYQHQLYPSNANNNQHAYARPTPHYTNQNHNYPLYPARHSGFPFFPLKFAKELYINELSVHRSFGEAKSNSIDARNSTKQYTLIETTKKP